MRSGAFVALLATVLSVSLGQILFKIAAMRTNEAHSLFTPRVLVVLCIALALYAGATLVWIWILRSTPLTVAYLCMSLSFATVPVLAAVFLNEPLTLRVAMGILLILAGIAISVQEGLH